MSQTQLNQVNAEPAALSAQQLEEAFAAFNRVSVELDTSYRELQVRVAQLTEELAEARSARLQELAEKERLANRLALLMGALPGGVVVLDPNHHVREVNPEAAQMLGHPLAGRPWQEILTRNTAELDMAQQELLTHNGRRLSMTRRSLPDGGEVVILLTDITELYALKEQVNREQRLSAMGEMAARLAHQIRTPLSSTLLYVSHLARPQLAETERQRVAEKMRDRLRHMEQLVTSMLTFVKGGACEAQPFGVDELLANLQELTRQPLAAVNGELKLAGDIPDATLNGNGNALSSALLNLVDNAIDIVGDGVEVTVATTTDNDQLIIRLADNGPGIADDIREQIFDPFFTTRIQGTGLGLAVVAATVRGHGGSIEVSNKDGGGAEFLIRLPLHCGETDSPENQQGISAASAIWQR
ncbi:ATP-binding protein [Porticoccus sp. W117]|uniref:sensor histidine kinase n=1 Tax=Porticoccus sp. W117 TaxID=3054777 RepID=UPI002596DFA5|nr:ATP-binding protein [Porticoccus sp. W117]MDM3871008.1 ATP-binding protein [Porticoccus sp. W117]